MIRSTFSLLLISLCLACDSGPSASEEGAKVTIFFVNDMHGSLDNFAKIRHIVDKEKETKDVLLVSAGDIFSGSPIVDQYEEKGFPIIDIMNQTGFDVSVIGNHEFDYGIDILKDRMEQATFDFVCANVDVGTSLLPQPEPFVTLEVGELRITILGLVETFGKPDGVIPSTHPWRVSELSFEHFFNMVDTYNGVKEDEGADVLMALSHMGTQAETSLAENFPFFDLIVGGHSNDLNKGTVNGIPMVMAGTRLSHLGKIEIEVVDKKIVNHNVELIKLSDYADSDPELVEAINIYNDNPEFDEVIGTANSHHTWSELGCFLTTAYKEYMQVDLAIQNSGGIRSELDEGDVTKLEIYEIDPFNNISVDYTMTALEIRTFLKNARTGLHITGVNVEQSGSEVLLRDLNGSIIPDTEVMVLGINDYIPAVYESYFPNDEANIRDLTTAETVIDYLKTMNSTVDHEGCDHYFKYN